MGTSEALGRLLGRVLERSLLGDRRVAPIVDRVARSPGSELSSAPWRAVDPRALLDEIRHQRVTGLALAALHTGLLENWTLADIDALHHAHLAALRTAVALEATAVRVSVALAEAGVDHALLKGGATAHLEYPDPALRTGGDVDLLVRREDFRQVERELDRMAIQRATPPFRSRWERRYAKDVIFTGDGGEEVDVHLGLVAGYFGVAMPTDVLFVDVGFISVGGHRVPVLGRPGRLVHAAIHTAATSPIRFGSACDIHRIAACGEVSVDQVSGLAQRLDCEALVASGVRRAWEAFGLSDCELFGWARSVRPTARESDALREVASDAGEVKWRSGLVALPLRDRPGYALPLLAPSRAYLRYRGRSLPQHLVSSWLRTRNV